MEDTACAKKTDDPDRLWSALARGEWTFVDRFDAGGRRYLVARRAGPDEAWRRPSPTEWKALEMRASGRSLKVIAADLGVSVSGAAALVRRATLKVGLREPSELLPLRSRGR